MQFKVVFALTLATLAAAGALPRADTDPNHAITNSANTNKDTTNQGTKIEPPVPGKDTIAPGECASGHLQCCKSALSPSASAVTPLLPSGYSVDNLSGLVGVTCAVLPADAKLKDCSDAPVCCTDISHSNASFGCQKVTLSS